MIVCVYGVWHLGSVVSAGLASLGHTVVGFDENEEVISALSKGEGPVKEPGLDSILKKQIAAKLLQFTNSFEDLPSNLDALWVTFDTPVDHNDQANVDFVFDRICAILPKINEECLILISSQLPVGTIRKIETLASREMPDKKFKFFCIPENLRLGQSMDIFLNPDRIVVGCRSVSDRQLLDDLFIHLTNKICWMGVESAEMTKHAINSFLAMSVSFANEVASICEIYGADAKEVEVGLKTEQRIGEKAYLGAGNAFGGGTLARDVVFLEQVSESRAYVSLIPAIKQSNDHHKLWVHNTLLDNFSPLSERKIMIWGLTYKPNTSTLRRSMSVELCDWLIDRCKKIYALDPGVDGLPSRWDNKIEKIENWQKPIMTTDVLIVMTQWSEFLDHANQFQNMQLDSLSIIDPARFLEKNTYGLNLPTFSVGYRFGVQN